MKPGTVVHMHKAECGLSDGKIHANESLLTCCARHVRVLHWVRGSAAHTYQIRT